MNLKKLKRVTGGVYRRTLRRFLPSLGPALMNNIPVVFDEDMPVASTDRKLFDRFLPKNFHYSTDSDYEEGLLKAQRLAEDVDKAALVGGGYGISGIHLAEYHNAYVSIYEAAEDKCRLIRKNIEFNELSSQIQVFRALVGENITVWGSAEGAEKIKPSELDTDLDLLELDCEGNEVDIIKSLEDYPDYLVVEFHPKKVDETFTEFQEILEENYEIRNVTGHDGKEITLEKCRQLCQDYIEKDQQHLDGGGRVPVVLLAEHN